MGIGLLVQWSGVSVQRALITAAVGMAEADDYDFF
jgi:hypothetical protein